MSLPGPQRNDSCGGRGPGARYSTTASIGGRGRLRSARPGSEGTCREPHSCTPARPAPPGLPPHCPQARLAPPHWPPLASFSNPSSPCLGPLHALLPQPRELVRSACAFSPRGRVLLSECRCRSLAVSSVRAALPATSPAHSRSPAPAGGSAGAWIPARGAFFSRVTLIESVIPAGPQFPPLGCLGGLAGGRGARTCTLTARSRPLGPRRSHCTRARPRGPSIHHPCVPGRVRDTGTQDAACPPPPLTSSLEPSSPEPSSP